MKRWADLVTPIILAVVAGAVSGGGIVGTQMVNVSHQVGAVSMQAEASDDHSEVITSLVIQIDDDLDQFRDAQKAMWRSVAQLREVAARLGERVAHLEGSHSIHEGGSH